MKSLPNDEFNVVRTAVLQLILMIISPVLAADPWLEVDRAEHGDDQLRPRRVVPRLHLNIALSLPEYSKYQGFFNAPVNVLVVFLDVPRRFE